MKNQVTRATLESLIKAGVDALTTDELVRLDEHGARFYLLTDPDDESEFFVSWGDPINLAAHEFAESQCGPKTHQKWEAWQEFKTAPQELRAYLHQRLPDDLIDAYQSEVADR